MPPRVLLTSSQVSIGIYSLVVILCTVALFLSGYVVQQATLRDLRAAIAPEVQRQKPLVTLPDRFRDFDGVAVVKGATDELPDSGESEDRDADSKGLSRAERRRKIKQEIIMAGQGEGFKGYKRRMW